MIERAGPGGPGATTVLAGGIVVDGRRGEPRRADVVVAGERIVAVGATSPSDRAGSDVLDVSGLVVAPGFIDAHSHADFTLPRLPDGTALLRQGCTTVVAGNCGFSPWPFVHGVTLDARDHGNFIDPDHHERWASLPDYAASLEATGVGVNLVPLCGHGAVRTGILGAVDRSASDAERGAIVRATEQALDDGAFGVSFGLAYPHGASADRDELTAVAEVVASRRAVLAVHLRDEGPGLMAAVEEMTSLAASTGCSLQLSHHKAAGVAQHGMVERSLDLVDAVRDAGVDVATDAYPYTMGATTLAAAMPDWSTGHGDAELRRLAADGEARTRALRDLRTGATRYSLGEIWIADASPRWAHLTGGMLVDHAARLGRDAGELLLDVIADEGTSASMLVFCMAPDDVHRVLRHRGTLVGSDGWVLDPRPGTHPRNFQTFPLMLQAGHRDEVGLGLADAVARMTGDVAARFGIPGRGVVGPGFAADLVAFDPATIGPGGGLGDPAGVPHGIAVVLVNGVESLPTATRATRSPRAGRVLRRGLRRSP